MTYVTYRCWRGVRTQVHPSTYTGSENEEVGHYDIVRGTAILFTLTTQATYFVRVMYMFVHCAVLWRGRGRNCKFLF